MTVSGEDQPSTDILARGNQIAKIGKDLDAPDAKIIDARGKYVMPGFVDAHKHLWVSTMRGQLIKRQGEFFPDFMTKKIPNIIIAVEMNTL